ncbi:MAG: imidazole glycerol phosphate synthase subunit HisH [Saprospiraceae bacterium]
MIAVIDYNAGNVRSVLYALERLGYEAALTNDATVIQQAEKVIFPGVGEARSTMLHLQATGLDEVIRGLKQPVLGICLGMQLLCRHSEENDAHCLNIIPAEVKRFRPVNGEKVPHIGWNTIERTQGSWLSESIDGQHVYFVHSFYVAPGPYTAALTHYIVPFTSVLRQDNFFATQFHPEKSGSIGEQVLKDFLLL